MGDTEAGPAGRGGTRRASTVRSALRVALQEARREGRMTAEHEVRALIADRLAQVVDGAAKAAPSGESTRTLLTAAEKLAEYLDTLPIRKPGDLSGGGGSGDGSSDRRGQLLQLMDSPPQVGDSANS